MLNLIGAAVTGFLVGVFARWFYPGEVPMGGLLTVLLGVGGALLASLVVGSRTGGYGNGVNRPGCLASVLGAMVLIYLGRHLGWN